MNRNKYKLVAIRAEGIVTLMGIHGQALWTRAKSRKSGKCHITGKTYTSGTEVFRPLTNGNDRMERITPDGMVKLYAKQLPGAS